MEKGTVEKPFWHGSLLAPFWQNFARSERRSLSSLDQIQQIYWSEGILL